MCIIYLCNMVFVQTQLQVVATPQDKERMSKSFSISAFTSGTTILIISHNNTDSENVISPQNVNNDEISPCTSDVMSSWDMAIKANSTWQSLCAWLQKKSGEPVQNVEFLCSCLARNSYPKGMILKVPLTILDAPM